MCAGPPGALGSPPTPPAASDVTARTTRQTRQRNTSRMTSSTRALCLQFAYFSLSGSALRTVLFLPLDGPRREPRQDASLQQERQRDQRHGHDDRRRHDLTPWDLEAAPGLPGEGDDRHRDGVLVDRLRERQRVQELVPRGYEREQPGGDEARRDQRQDYLVERLEGRGAVDIGRLLQILPASAPKASEMSVTDPATIVEFSSARWKSPLPSTSRKLLSVGCSGKYWTGVLKRSPSGVNAERIAQ